MFENSPLNKTKSCRQIQLSLQLQNSTTTTTTKQLLILLQQQLLQTFLPTDVRYIMKRATFRGAGQQGKRNGTQPNPS